MGKSHAGKLVTGMSGGMKIIMGSRLTNAAKLSDKVGPAHLFRVDHHQRSSVSITTSGGGGPSPGGLGIGLRGGSNMAPSVPGNPWEASLYFRFFPSISRPLLFCLQALRWVSSSSPA